MGEVRREIEALERQRQVLERTAKHSIVVDLERVIE